MRKQYLFRIGMVCLATTTIGIMSAFAATSDARASSADEAARNEAAVIAVDQHWLEAEESGDTDYRSVGADGVAHPKSAIVAHAAKNRGSDTERRTVEAWIKAHPSGKSVVLHGDSAILSFYDPASGPQQGVRSSDIFVYVDGRWHALYSQHSGFDKG
jgi:hypothetical protein